LTKTLNALLLSVFVNGVFNYLSYLFGENEMEDKQLEEADWRCHTVIRVAKDTNVPGLGELKAGDLGRVVGISNYKSKRVAFTVPRATALFLNLSQRHYEEAREIAQEFSVAPTLQSLDDEDAFAYLENIMASVVFAYTALESFANEEIPKDYIYTVDKGGRCQEVYNKVQIEKFLTLADKLGKILPAVCGVRSPKGIKVWQDYLELESLRHSIIHMKEAERDSRLEPSKSVWGRLIKSPVPYWLPVAKRMIDHFYKPRKAKPHWYEKFPF
jgi:hypothetical protein